MTSEELLRLQSSARDTADLHFALSSAIKALEVAMGENSNLKRTLEEQYQVNRDVRNERDAARSALAAAEAKLGEQERWAKSELGNMQVSLRGQTAKRVEAEARDRELRLHLSGVLEIYKDLMGFPTNEKHLVNKARAALALRQTKPKTGTYAECPLASCLEIGMCRYPGDCQERDNNVSQDSGEIG